MQINEEPVNGQGMSFAKPVYVGPAQVNRRIVKSKRRTTLIFFKEPTYVILFKQSNLAFYLCDWIIERTFEILEVDDHRPEP